MFISIILLSLICFGFYFYFILFYLGSAISMSWFRTLFLFVSFATAFSFPTISHYVSFPILQHNISNYAAHTISHRIIQLSFCFLPTFSICLPNYYAALLFKLSHNFCALPISLRFSYSIFLGSALPNYATSFPLRYLVLFHSLASL